MGNGEWLYHDVRIAGQNFPGAHVHESIWSDLLAESAQANSKRCAYLGRGGHHNWDDRFQELIKTGLANTFSEINAESWKRQEGNNPTELFEEAFRCWRQSGGHWQVASRQYILFGAGLAKSSRGIWYMSVVTAGKPLENPVPATINSYPEYKVW
jgi:hypothetical protein